MPRECEDGRHTATRPPATASAHRVDALLSRAFTDVPEVTDAVRAAIVQALLEIYWELPRPVESAGGPILPRSLVRPDGTALAWRGGTTRCRSCRSTDLPGPDGGADGAPARAPGYRPGYVKRVLDAIHADPARAYTVVELSQLAGVKVRTLQHGFRTHLGTSPMAYLRSVRLSGAYDDLIGDDSIGIAEVAHRWGFTHLGRFAAMYADRYGEAPSQTRRRRSPG